eukprot:scaffold2914_cov107-Cylindrotheca_fusiformis.AAC.2
MFRIKINFFLSHSGIQEPSAELIWYHSPFHTNFKSRLRAAWNQTSDNSRASVGNQYTAYETYSFWFLFRERRRLLSLKESWFHVLRGTFSIGSKEVLKKLVPRRLLDKKCAKLPVCVHWLFFQASVSFFVRQLQFRLSNYFNGSGLLVSLPSSCGS